MSEANTAIVTGASGGIGAAIAAGDAGGWLSCDLARPRQAGLVASGSSTHERSTFRCSGHRGDGDGGRARASRDAPRAQRRHHQTQSDRERDGLGYRNPCPAPPRAALTLLGAIGRA